ncbi:MAG: sulfite exporter TauE/SafE family protein [bacterium]|nr:sulfite exporter TauE/SafE family protein [bacterium]
MYFPLSGVTVDPWLPPLVAFVISFFTSMGGISGAFLLLPFQMSFLHYTHPSVSSTNQLYNIVAIPPGVYRYWREGRMLWPLTWTVVLGTLPGVLIGALVRVNGLRDPKNFKLFAAMVLLYIGGKLVLDQLKKNAGAKRPSEQRFQRAKNGASAGSAAQDYTVQVMDTSLRRFSFTFQGEYFDVNRTSVFLLCFVVGIVGGIYGIGGGAIIAPFLVSFCKLPIYTIGGATLMGTLVTSVAGVAFYTAIAPFYPQLAVAPDWLLGLLFGLGGMLGMYCGARCQKYVPAKLIKWLLAVIILLTASRYLLEFFS